MKNELAKDIVRGDEKLQYDTQCKKVLANKTILAWILKHTAEEFRGMEISAIKACMEGEPEISSVRVEPGHTNPGERITGETNEDKVNEEGAVYFDIRFSVRLPGKSGGNVKLIINVEAQKGFYPGYDIVTRGIFYAARLISAQLGTEFTHSHYDDIKKVYSIWLCMNAPKKIGNAVSKFLIKKEDLLPGIPDKVSGYDKITVIQICLKGRSEEKESTESELTGMLNVLFDSEMDSERKIKRLEEEYHIEMETKLGKELNQMCNLSDWVEEIGIQKGMEQGMERGMERGEIFALIKQVQKKCRKDKSLEETADELEEEVQNIERIYRLVKENPEKTEKDIWGMLEGRE